MGDAVIAACGIGAVLAVAPAASADVVRLVNGDVLQGEVGEAGADGFRLRRYDSGGLVRLGWAQVLQADRDALQRRFALDADAPAREWLAWVNLSIAQRRFADAAIAWAELLERFPDSAVVTEHAGRLLPRLLGLRTAWLDAQVRPRWMNQMAVLANRRARERKTVQPDGSRTPFTLDEAKTWARERLPGEIAQAVAKRLGIAPDEAREVFARRRAWDLTRASYGGGTFIVEDPAGPVLPGPAPVSPAEWWARALAAERQEWMTAFYAEHGGDMTVVRIEESACQECGGRGHKCFLAPGLAGAAGGVIHIACPRCRGVDHDRVVVFR